MPRCARSLAVSASSSAAISKSMIPSFAVALDLVQVVRAAGEAFVSLGEAALTRGVGEEPRHSAGELISGRAFDIPVGPQLLVRRKDLLDDEIDRAGALGTQSRQ